MPTLDDVYRKFGEASEAAQLLETALGTLLVHKCIDAGLFENPDPSRATAIYDQINKQTLGRLIRSLGKGRADFPTEKAEPVLVRRYLLYYLYVGDGVWSKIHPSW